MILGPFTYTASNGSRYVVEAEVTYQAPLSLNKHTAASRDDLLGELEVDDILVVDGEGNDVTEEVYVPDHVILKELELQEQQDCDWDYEDLTIKHIADDSDWYSEEMYNV